MNKIAWEIIGTAIISVVILIFGDFKGIWALAIFAITVFVLIFGALIIGKFFFPI